MQQVRTASLFRNGRNQALHMPFEFEGSARALPHADARQQ